MEEFSLGMLRFGIPVESVFVGAYDDHARGARRDMELPYHRDGEYSRRLALQQGNHYVEIPDVTLVGFYCLVDNPATETLLIATEAPADSVRDDAVPDETVRLRKGQALVFDNKRVVHARRGPVGDRVLFRIWVTRRG